MRRFLPVFVLAVAVSVTTAVALAGPTPGATFKGKTSQKQRVSLKATADGLGLKGFSITREFDCGDDNDPITGTFRQSGGTIVVNANGGFKAKGKVQGFGGGSRIKSGTFRIKGKFGTRGRIATGVYRERVALEGGVECGTGRVTFRVKQR